MYDAVCLRSVPLRTRVKTLCWYVWKVCSHHYDHMIAGLNKNVQDILELDVILGNLQIENPQTLLFVCDLLHTPAS